MRSSATVEDLPEASFAGQQETVLNVRGIEAVLEAVKRVFASLYNDRAIAYRAHHGFAHETVVLSAGVQRMVRSDVGTSGVLFTLDTESGFPERPLDRRFHGNRPPRPARIQSISAFPPSRIGRGEDRDVGASEVGELLEPLGPIRYAGMSRSQ